MTTPPPLLLPFPLPYVGPGHDALYPASSQAGPRQNISHPSLVGAICGQRPV